MTRLTCYWLAYKLYKVDKRDFRCRQRAEIKRGRVQRWAAVSLFWWNTLILSYMLLHASKFSLLFIQSVNFCIKSYICHLNLKDARYQLCPFVLQWCQLVSNSRLQTSMNTLFSWSTWNLPESSCVLGWHLWYAALIPRALFLLAWLSLPTSNYEFSKHWVHMSAAAQDSCACQRPWTKITQRIIKNLPNTLVL